MLSNTSCKTKSAMTKFMEQCKMCLPFVINSRDKRFKSHLIKDTYYSNNFKWNFCSFLLYLTDSKKEFNILRSIEMKSKMTKLKLKFNEAKIELILVSDWLNGLSTINMGFFHVLYIPCMYEYNEHIVLCIVQYIYMRIFII